METKAFITIEREMMYLIRKIKQATNIAFHPLRAVVLMANYIANHYERVVWIVGDGRSGTTWLSELINYDRRFRYMFEPFHPIIRDGNKNMTLIIYPS